MKKRFMRHALVFAILVFVITVAANRFYWYYSIFGFDKIVHTLGGIFCALLVVALFSERLPQRARARIIAIIFWVFVIGFVWELYEYVVQFYIKSVELANIPDSIGDILFDMLGGLIGAVFVISNEKRYTVRDE
jgi:hypothetical protein